MPDQYTLAAFQRLELAEPDRAPVMAEIDLVSSHTPWTPLPRLVAWDAVGDGSVFDGDAGSRVTRADARSGATTTRSARRTAQSIQYSLHALVSFVADATTDPTWCWSCSATTSRRRRSSGDEASHDVPISIVAHDPAVLDRIAGWGWQDGLRPGPSAPVWPMDAFRDRFLAAYSTPQG